MSAPVPVYVEWIDSAYRVGWQHVDGLNPAKIITLGWLLESTDSHIVVSAHYDMDGGESHSPMTIPRCSITDFNELELL